MATWYYNRPYELCAPSELRVAKALSTLGDEWLVRWGFFYEVDREGDFLVLGPTGGLLVMEVKGGQLRNLSVSGRWEGEEADHPLTQLAGEWKGVLQRLESFAERRRLPYVGKALCVPDLTVEAGATEFRGIARQLVVDRRDLEDFAEAWRQRIFPKNVTVLSEARSIFVEAYAAELTPKAIRHFISETDRLLFRHLQGDFGILEMLRGNRQLFIEGGPGTGKTWLALEQAYRYAEEGDGHRVLLLCYNLMLGEMLRLAVAKRRPERGEVVVRSWELLARELFAGAGLAWSDPEEEERHRYYAVEVPALMREIVQEPGFRAPYDALVVDEAQDHDTATETGEFGWWETYFALLREGTEAPMALCYDSGQRPVFRTADGFDAEELRARLPRSAHVQLPYARRYTRPIFEFLQSLTSATTQRMVEALRTDRALLDGPPVQAEEWAAEEIPARVGELIAQWTAGGFCRPEQVLVLTRQSLRKSSLAGHGALGEWALTESFQGKPGEIVTLTARRAKGLDSLAVVLVDFPPFHALPEGQEKMDFFIGASRARQLLAVVSQRGGG